LDRKIFKYDRLLERGFMKYIETENLRVAYGKPGGKETLKGVNLNVERGHIFGLLGPNGAGKTTLIKTLLGLIPQYSGKVSVLGYGPGDLKSKKRIGFMPEIANYYWYMTPKEILLMFANIFGMDRAAAERRSSELLVDVGLESDAGVMVKNFSKGMMQKLNFAQALIGDPDLLILDEPTGGLDPILRVKMRDKLKELRSKDKTILLSSHELSEIELICDCVAVMNKGTILREGPLDEMLSKKEESVTLESFFFNIIKD
jgi:ABC-2 type transport system ATP-binding protein